MASQIGHPGMPGAATGAAAGGGARPAPVGGAVGGVAQNGAVPRPDVQAPHPNAAINGKSKLYNDFMELVSVAGLLYLALP